MSVNQATFPIATMARVLGVSEAGYHAWRKRPPSKKQEADTTLLKSVRTIHASSCATYGAPRVHAELRAGGEKHGRKRIARLMRAAGLVGASRRRSGITTTRRDREARPAPDLVDRKFAAPGPNRLWVADITFVPTASGFLYLAVVLDAWSRKIVGWAMANHIRAELVVDALEMAIGQRRPGDVIHHSDQGSQGEFNWSSQHPGEECWDGRSASIRSSVAEQAAFAGATSGRAADAPSAFLGIDRGWPIERGRGDWCGRVGAGRSEMVSGGRRHATIDACAIIEVAVRSLSIVCRAGGACNPACPGFGGAADRSQHGAIGIDDLTRAASQRCDTRRRTGLSGKHCAVAC